MKTSDLNKKERHFELKKATVFESVFYISFIIFLFLTRSSYHLLFHTSAEFYICLISFFLFFIILNDKGIGENNFIIPLGIGYLFAGILDVLHIFTYSGVSIIFKEGNQSIVVQFWISARYLTAASLLISTYFLYKQVKKFNLYFLFFSFFTVCVLFISSILYFKSFPDCYIIGQGLTSFKIISEYILCAVLIIVAVLYYSLKNNMDKKLFYYMEAHFITMAIAEIFFTNFFSPYDWTNIWAHIIRVISYIFLYKAVIETALKRPYAILYKIDNKLNITNKMLLLEQNQRIVREKMLVKNDQCYELIINNSSDAIIVIDKTNFVFANDSAAKIFGFDKPNDLIGLDLLNFIHTEDRSFLINFFETAPSKLTSFVQCNYKIISQSGELIYAESKCNYLFYHNKMCYLLIIKDTSSQKQICKLKKDMKENEQALIKTKEHSKHLLEYFSNISHEFKTPLNVILSSIQLLTFKNIVPANHLNVIKHNCYRLLRLVNNLIDLSKFDSGYIKINLTNQDIVGLVKGIITSIEDYIENHDLSISFNSNIDKKIIAVDTDSIERIILNLLSNSIKFTDKCGSIFVEIKDMNNRIYISVRDTGIGIEKDKLNSIFNRFEQINKSLPRNKEGSGIGLALVKKLVEMHEGSISISSAEHFGCEVNIELPVRIIDDSDSRIKNDSIIDNFEKVNIEFSDI